MTPCLGVFCVVIQMLDTFQDENEEKEGEEDEDEDGDSTWLGM